MDKITISRISLSYDFHASGEQIKVTCTRSVEGVKHDDDHRVLGTFPDMGKALEAVEIDDTPHGYAMSNLGSVTKEAAASICDTMDAAGVSVPDIEAELKRRKGKSGTAKK